MRGDLKDGGLLGDISGGTWAQICDVLDLLISFPPPKGLV